MIKAVHFDDTNQSIVFTPLGRPLKKETKLTRKHIEEMFKCLRDLHKNDIIHRELSFKHFYLTNDEDFNEYMFLIDFGSAIFEKDGEEFYSGNIQFAANEIIDHHQSGM